MEQRMFDLFDIAREAIEKHGLEFVSLTVDNYDVFIFSKEDDIYGYAFLKSEKAITETYRWDGERLIECIS